MGPLVGWGPLQAVAAASSIGTIVGKSPIGIFEWADLFFIFF